MLFQPTHVIFTTDFTVIVPYSLTVYEDKQGIGNEDVNIGLIV